MYILLKRVWLLLWICSVLLTANGTLAGTSIANHASIVYAVNGVSQASLSSNIDTFLVDRKIDVLIAVNNSPVDTTPGASQVKLNFTVANQGNDDENWTLSLAENAVDDFDVDTLADCHLYDSGGNDLGLLPQDKSFNVDQNITYDVGCDIPATATSNQNAEIFLIANIKDRPNHSVNADNQALVQNVYADGASDNGDALHNGQYAKGGTYHVLLDATLTLQKTVTYSTVPVHTGTIIHYSIKSVVSGPGTATNIVIHDSYDNNLTSYIPNSIKLDGVALSDAGHIAGNTITVNENNMTSADTHTVTFDVQIQ